MLRQTLSAVGILVLAVAAAACGGDGGTSAEDIAELEALATRVVEAGPEDAVFFVEHTTERGLEIFGTGAEDCPEMPEACAQDSPPEVLNTFGTVIEADRASTNLTIDGLFVMNVAFLKDDGVWKADGAGFSDRIPASVITIEVTAVDYAFEWDPANVKSRNVAFSMKNDDEVEHGISVGKLSDNFDLDALIESLENGDFSISYDAEERVGIEFVGETGGGPGTTVNLVFGRDLEPGRYMLLDQGMSEDGTSFVAMGMYSEFTVP